MSFRRLLCACAMIRLTVAFTYMKVYDKHAPLFWGKLRFRPSVAAERDLSKIFSTYQEVDILDAASDSFEESRDHSLHFESLEYSATYAPSNVTEQNVSPIVRNDQIVSPSKQSGSSILMKSASMGLTYGLADIFAQVFARIVEGEMVPMVLRLRRSVSLIAVGLLAVGPLLTLWFELIEKLIPGKSKRAVAGRTALDQLIEAPLMIALIFTLSSLAEGQSVAFCIEKIRLKLFSSWLNCIAVWTPAQLINQGLIPLKYRVYFQAIVSFFWDAYLSIVSHSVKT